MQLALQHAEHGYYRVREPLGREGDFVTAPEISQMFGEMSDDRGLVRGSLEKYGKA